MLQIPHILRASALGLLVLLAGCAGNSTKDPAPETADAAGKSEPRVYPSLASSTFPDGDPAPEGPRGRSTDDIKLANPHQASDELEERVLERWALLIANRGQEAYDYLTPGYRTSKQRDTYASEMAARPVRWKALGVNNKTCASETSCEVSVWSETEVKLSVAMGANTVFGGHLEQWLKIDGVWYYLPRH